jgi:hypothetical protein
LQQATHNPAETFSIKIQNKDCLEALIVEMYCLQRACAQPQSQAAPLRFILYRDHKEPLFQNTPQTDNGTGSGSNKNKHKDYCLL